MLLPLSRLMVRKSAATAHLVPVAVVHFASAKALRLALSVILLRRPGCARVDDVIDGFACASSCFGCSRTHLDV